MENISTHISYKEATKCNAAIRAGIENKPNEEELVAMKLVAINCFEPLRRKFGALVVTSFFRNRKCNKLTGGSDTSSHTKGEAIDIDGDSTGISNLDIFNWAKDNLTFDQLIWEFTNEDGTPCWVHISYKLTGNRNQILKAIKIKNAFGKLITKYIPYE